MCVCIRIDSSSVKWHIARIPRSREVRQSWLTTVVYTAKAILSSVPIVLRTLPDVILCNGPGTCVPICLVAYIPRFLGIKTIRVVYVESICRVHTLSLTGKILYNLADLFVVQWPTLCEKYPRAVYVGRFM
jgi:beta-1,4-N-acetylglucosaminyltransferase